MKRTERGILIEGKQVMLELSILSEGIIRVQKRTNEKRMISTSDTEELILTGSLPAYDGWTVQETADSVRVETQKLCAAYSLADDSLRFYRNGAGKSCVKRRRVSSEIRKKTGGQAVWNKFLCLRRMRSWAAWDIRRTAHAIIKGGLYI